MISDHRVVMKTSVWPAAPEMCYMRRHQDTGSNNYRLLLVQYTFRTASYSRSHSNTAICYIAISNIQQPYISVSVSCDTKEHQYTFLTGSYSISHSYTAVPD